MKMMMMMMMKAQRPDRPGCRNSPTLLHLLLLTGCIAASQRNDNVYVSGISNACGDVAELLRGSSGVITSPGWPFQYPARLNCSWNIRARPGDTITI
ncbi:low-density lipoprotein receptor-related protein 12-like, partial [Anoplopoma fimbria]|uniref:low-density lipoprotein receptor-related protein 12-like n=1 Tax=Anoplopoma fimbria TaxID=229290 RepID=UPI0023EB266D